MGVVPLEVVVFVFGAVVGSFLNVCIHRIPLGESIVRPRSRCPRCRALISATDNVPILSWLWLRGRCRSCGSPIPVRYPFVELVTASAAVGALLEHGPAFEAFVLFVFLAALIVITFVDLDHRIIPDVISLPGIVVGFATSWVVAPGPVSSALGILLGGGILWALAEGYARLRGKEGMGLGDVKLLAMIGAFLGWESIPFTLLVSSLAGTVVGVAVMIRTKSDLGVAIPFGPFLALGAAIFAFFGPEVLSWYLGRPLPYG